MNRFEEYLNDTNPQIEIIMENGNSMKLELFPSCAPITVDNMLNLVSENFFDGIKFHRIIKNFVIQGGDPTGTGMGGSKTQIKGEFRINGVKNDLLHTKGVISMARTNNPNSASSQFFICHADCKHLDCSYAGFGVVIEGMDTLDKIANVDTDRYDYPIVPQIIKTIKRIR